MVESPPRSSNIKGFNALRQGPRCLPSGSTAIILQLGLITLEERANPTRNVKILLNRLSSGFFSLLALYEN